jgi:3-dehydroquinate synthase
MDLREIPVHLPGRESSYRIVLGAGLRHRLGEHLAQVLPGRRLWVVTDALVDRLYGRELVDRLNRQGIPAGQLTVARGERSKSWPVVARLTQQLLSQGADRGSALVALGGGVVGDLTGFLAALFMRGIPVVQVPTTLLAMVDAAIGGKTAINIPAGKNLLGAFHQPHLVLLDPEFLLTLPARERRNGLAEVVKTGFIRDAGLLELLAGPGRPLFQDRQLRDRELLTEIIGRAAAHKAQVVAADEREGDLRRILNFGHTLGHALEKASHFKLKHGEAVAVGLAAALDFSVQLTGLSAAAARQGQTLLAALGLPVRPPMVSRDEVLRALQVDKKKQGARLVFVLLRSLGQAVVHPEVPLGLIEAWLDHNSPVRE